MIKPIRPERIIPSSRVISPLMSSSINYREADRRSLAHDLQAFLEQGGTITECYRGQIGDAAIMREEQSRLKMMNYRTRQHKLEVARQEKARGARQNKA